MQVNLIVDALPAHAGRLLADTPVTWQDPEPMSKLHALLLFVGVPAGLFVLITLLTLAPSIIRGPRYRPGRDWAAEPQLFGAVPSGRADRPQLEGPAGAREDDKETGGASAGW